MTGHLRYLDACGHVRASGRAVKADALAAEWRAVDAVKASAERPIAEAFARLMREQEAAALEAWRVVAPGLARAGAGPQAQKRGEATGTLLLDVGAWLDEIAEAFGPLLRSVLAEGFGTGLLRVGAQELAFRLTPRAEQALAEGVALVQGTTQTTQAALGRIVEDGLSSGQTTAQIGRAIAGRFAEWTGERARLVAEDQAQSVFEAGQLDAFQEAGVGEKRWLSQRDGQTRPAHDAADGQQVPTDEAFTVDGEALMYPGDRAGSASNTIRCRCTSLPVTAPPKALTRKQRRDRHIRARYREVKAHGDQGQRAQKVYDEGFEGEPYMIAVETLLRIAKGKG